MTFSRSILLLFFCLLPAASLAQDTSSRPHTTASVEDASAGRCEIYNRFLKHRNADQGEAAKAAKLYLERFSADQDEIVKYLKDFLIKYEGGGFRFAAIGCGIGMTRATYEVPEGGSLFFTVWPYASPEKAAAVFDEWVKSLKAVKSLKVVSDRQPTLDAAGQQIGERMVVSNEKVVCLLKLEGKTLISIEARSAGVIERFERFESLGR